MKAIDYKEFFVNSPFSGYFKEFKNGFFVFVEVNKAKAENSNMSREQMIGKSDWDFMSEEDASKAHDDDMRVFNGETIIDRVEKITTHDGNVRYNSVTKTPWILDGKIIGVQGISVDITRRIEIEGLVRDYFSGLFHDLKTMFSGVNGIIKNIINERYGKLPEPILNRLTSIYKATMSGEKITTEGVSRNKSLGFEKVRLPMKEVRVDVGLEIIDQILSLRSDDIEEMNINIDNTLGSVPENTVYIYSNPHALQSIFDNLISNAIKYGGYGCNIAYGYEVKEDIIIFNVYNSGPPIPHEFVENGLFEKFQRDSSNVEGHGIGLYHARKLARDLGGDLIYEETPSHHPNFLLILPLQNEKALT